MYFIILSSIHSILCIVLIGLVLLQQGKGADAGVTIGGGGNSLFGAAGSADFITKLTTSLAIGFMITSILMIRGYQAGGATVFSRQSDPLAGSVLEETVKEAGVQKEQTAKEDKGSAGADTNSEDSNIEVKPITEPKAKEVQEQDEVAKDTVNKETVASDTTTTDNTKPKNDGAAKE